MEIEIGPLTLRVFFSKTGLGRINRPRRSMTTLLENHLLIPSYPHIPIFSNRNRLKVHHRFGGAASRMTAPNSSLRISKANLSTWSSSSVLSDV